MPDTEDSTPYSPIQCQLYDYIEVACLRHYELEIELVTNDQTMSDRIIGQAKTTLIKDKQEFLILDIEKSQVSGSVESKEIRLDLIKSIKPLDENAEFGLVTIT